MKHAYIFVDTNNHGPSYIIGLGDSKGGDLCTYDPDRNGNHEMEIAEPIRGRPHLKPGMKVWGNLVSISNKWVKFNGNNPHAV